ncbi:MAG: GerMN domain-containing protein [Acidobacteria bacterium]|nr:GerMN domain-containing protein [Acidobacteriota bacterium]
MTARGMMLTLAGLVLAAFFGWVLLSQVTRLFGPPLIPTAATPAVQAPTVAPTPRARTRVPVWVVAADGTHLVTIPQDMVQESSPLDQARGALDALLTLKPRPPLTSAIPTGTTLLGLYATDTGEIYVDLGGDVARAHPGGTLREVLTTYSVVHTVLDAMPSATAVQILIDGREVETLAGHVDLRRPLRRADHLTRPPGPSSETRP